MHSRRRTSDLLPIRNYRHLITRRTPVFGMSKDERNLTVVTNVRSPKAAEYRIIENTASASRPMCPRFGRGILLAEPRVCRDPLTWPTIKCNLCVFFRALVNIFLTIDLLGCCCVYIVFVSKNIKQVMCHVFLNVVHRCVPFLPLLAGAK